MRPKISTRGRKQLADRIIESARPNVEALARRDGQAMEGAVKRIIRRDFVVDRPVRRRRTPGSTRLINSFTSRTEPGRTGAVVRAVLTTKPGVSTAKILRLNYGGKSYTMSTRSNGMSFPETTGMSQRAKKFHSAYGQPDIRVRTVKIPRRGAGSRGIKFMERARTEAVRLRNR